MAYKNTIAIIGAAEGWGAFIAKGISKGHYRVLLVDSDINKLGALQTGIIELYNRAEVAVVECCKDASWEADIIVLAVAEEYKKEAVQKMKEVATCKTIINVTSPKNGAINLRELLPYSKVVNFSTAAHSAEEINDVLIYGSDEEAVAFAEELIQTISLPYNVIL